MNVPLLEPCSKGERIIIKRLFKDKVPAYADTQAYWKEDGTAIVIYDFAVGKVFIGIEQKLPQKVRGYWVNCPNPGDWTTFAEQVCQAIKEERWQEVVTMFGFKRLQ